LLEVEGSLEMDVGLEIIENLVVPEKRVLGQNQERLDEELVKQLNFS
jgi:hypothetical protein